MMRMKGEKRKKQNIKSRKPMVALYDMPVTQWTYSIPGPGIELSISIKSIYGLFLTKVLPIMTNRKDTCNKL